MPPQSRDTLIANLYQQVAAFLLFLVLPNILSVEHYAEIIFSGFLLSLAKFGDLGFSFVYSRKLPKLYGREDKEEIKHWNHTAYSFCLLGNLLYGVIAGLALYYKFGDFIGATLFSILPAMLSLIILYVANVNAQQDFRAYRWSLSGQSVLKIFAIPLAIIFGATGWFVAQLVSAGYILVRCAKFYRGLSFSTDWRTLKRSLPYGIQLGLIAVIWAQIVDFARLLASVHYGKLDIATYGLLTTGYQSACALVIAFFIPASLNTLVLLDKDFSKAMDYVLEVTRRASLTVFILAILGAELFPLVLKLLFPQYSVDPFIPKTMFYGLIGFPFIATFGNLLLETRHRHLYLLILILDVMAYFVVERLLYPYHGVRSAALAQAGATLSLGIALVVAVCKTCPEMTKSHCLHLMFTLGGVAILAAIYGVIKFMIF